MPTSSSSLFIRSQVATNESVPAVYETWIKLWPFVFQPAIGILMAGALLSGLVGWFKDNVVKSDD